MTTLEDKAKRLARDPSWRVEKFKEFVKFSTASTATFAFDVFLLWLFSARLGFPYLKGAIFAFVVSVSVGFAINKAWVFKGTRQEVLRGYAMFFLIALLDIFLIVGLLSLLVEHFGVYYIHARIFVGIFVGIWNYVLNSFFNFKTY
jgi:putative flippase GtrA